MGVQESMFNAQVERLEKSVSQNQAAIDEIVMPYGGLEALEAMHDAKVSSIARLDEKTTELAVQKADSQLKTTPDQQGYELLAMIASGNPTGTQTPAQASIQDLIEEDAQLQAKIDRLRARGYGGRHPDVRSLKSAREQIAEAADHRKKLVNQIIESIGLPSSIPTARSPDPADHRASRDRAHEPPRAPEQGNRDDGQRDRPGLPAPGKG